MLKTTHPFYGSYAWKQLRSKVSHRWKAKGLPCAYCGKPLDWITPAATAVDHILSRDTHPHLALTLANLRVVHKTCNQHLMAPRPKTGNDGWPI